MSLTDEITMRYSICENIMFTPSDNKSTIMDSLEGVLQHPHSKFMEVKYPYITDLLYNGIKTETTFVIFKLEMGRDTCIGVEYCSIIDEHTAYFTDIMYSSGTYYQQHDIKIISNLLKYMKVENDIYLIPELHKIYEFFKLYHRHFTTDNFILDVTSTYRKRWVFKLDPKLLYTEYNKNMIKLNVINNAF